MAQDLVNLGKLEQLNSLGSTSVFFRVGKGIVLKAAVSVSKDRQIQLRPTVEKHYVVEEQILARLGHHPRIVTFLGSRIIPRGLLFTEASHGALQQYLDSNNVPQQLRQKWFRQAIECVVYIHSKGVVHCDLRPDNFLVNEVRPNSLNILLCDFGGSVCEELGLDGDGLPDAGFSEPGVTDTPTPLTDLFSLGSVLYTILTGHWPHREPGGPFRSPEEMEEYENRVNNLFRGQRFPEVDGLYGGYIIAQCWAKQYGTAADALRDAENLSTRPNDETI